MHTDETPPISSASRSPYLLAAAFLLGMMAGLLMARFWLFVPEPLVLQVPTPAPLPPTATPMPIQVYVTGAVRSPGVYTLPYRARLKDLLALAGGLAADADPKAVNLAQPLQDGQHLHIPAQGDKPARASASSTKPTPEVAFPVDINLADQAALEAIPGIGPATAARIIAARPYSQVEDLLRVKGIGDATLEKLRPYVTVGQ